MPESFTEQEKRILDPFVTNTEKPIFALRNLPEVIKGALFSRYSRSSKGLRRLLLDEFVENKDIKFSEIAGLNTADSGSQMLAVQKAKDFYDRILDGFGDDSIGELGGAHLACEQVSIIATKIIEDSRIGGSPLEKSTRYLFFDQKSDGDYQFYKEPAIIDSEFRELYLETCRFLFDTYSKLIEPMKEFAKKAAPKEEGVSDMAYNFSIRARACDALRGLLPASTLTNMGVFGNGRFFEYLLLKLRCSELAEMRDLAGTMHEELNKIIPSFVRKADAGHKHFKPHKEFIQGSENAVLDIADKNLAGIKPEHRDEVELVEYDADAEDKLIAMILYRYSKHPISQLKGIVKKMSPAEKEKIIHEALCRRTNRRHKPGRAFENIYYTFDMLADYGIYRDLQRHRILTQERQDLTAEHGYAVPADIIDAGFEKDFRLAMEKAADAYYKISKKFPKEAQYAVPLAYKIRWYNKINLRSLYWLIELRTGKQGHAHYRAIAQDMYRKIAEVHPLLVKYMSFTDMNTYSLGRLDAEKRKEERARQKS